MEDSSGAQSHTAGVMFYKQQWHVCIVSPMLRSGWPSGKLLQKLVTMVLPFPSTPQPLNSHPITDKTMHLSWCLFFSYLSCSFFIWPSGCDVKTHVDVLNSKLRFWQTYLNYYFLLIYTSPIQFPHLPDNLVTVFCHVTQRNQWVMRDCTAPQLLISVSLLPGLL